MEQVKRKSSRLTDYDYSADGAYFVTICTENKQHILGCGSSRTPTPTNARLPAFISTWKRFTNKKAGISIWQRSYYDHIIRSEADYLRIWQYIDENPAKWAEDEYYTL